MEKEQIGIKGSKSGELGERHHKTHTKRILSEGTEKEKGTRTCGGKL